MDNQPAPVVPTNPSPLATDPTPYGAPGSKSNGILFVLIAVLGLGTVGFGLLAVTSYNAASVATKTLSTQKLEAANAAKDAQKKVDDQANTIASESPFRSYFAPVQFGSFEIKFPKNWSGYVDQEQSGTQVQLVLNPDFVRRTNGLDELAGARVSLVEKSSDTALSPFSSQIKRGTITESNITVSGLAAFDLTGQFQDKKTTREVIVPVRDKVMIFINENAKYATEFNAILAQSKIVP